MQSLPHSRGVEITFSVNAACQNWQDRRMAGHVQVRQRVDRVCRMLQNGVLPMEVKRFCRDEWEISERQAEVYMQRANRLIVESISSDDRKEYHARMIATVHTILTKSMRDGNWSCALGAAAQLSKLTGLESNSR